MHVVKIEKTPVWKENVSLASKKILYVILDSEDMTEYVSYEKWMTKNIPIVVKNVEKLSLRTFKTIVRCSKRELVMTFKEYFPKIMKHTANIKL